MEDMNKILESVTVALGAKIVEQNSTVALLEWKLEDAKKDNEKATATIVSLKKLLAESRERVEELEGEKADLAEKLYLAQERIAIQNESDAPLPMWDIEPKPKEVSEVTSVTNVSNVIIEEDVE